MPYILTFKTFSNNHQIALPASKSESNRALIIQALSKGQVSVKNLSSADDTVVLQSLLHSEKPIQDVHHAGTTMRFLTAYYAIKGKEVILTGSARMKQRPIKILVDALRTLGADIEYLERDGCPPIKIHAGFKQKTDRIAIPGNISSQYLSALLMIAPQLERGLTLSITDTLTSKPYIEMTLSLLRQAGINYLWNGNEIRIDRQPFKPGCLEVESDWSAASYWYSIAALSKNASFILQGLKPNSLQGDSKIVSLMEDLGVKTEFIGRSVRITKDPSFDIHSINEQVIDCTSFPDLAQTLAVTYGGLKKKVRFTGLHTLRIKETDRIQALQNELKKAGINFVEYKKDLFELDFDDMMSKHISIDTYHDHRMALAFAPLAIVLGTMAINGPMVVTKSYPTFWDDIEKIGFEIDKFVK